MTIKMEHCNLWQGNKYFGLDICTLTTFSTVYICEKVEKPCDWSFGNAKMRFCTHPNTLSTKRIHLMQFHSQVWFTFVPTGCLRVWWRRRIWLPATASSSGLAPPPPPIPRPHHYPPAPTHTFSRVTACIRAPARATEILDGQVVMKNLLRVCRFPGPKTPRQTRHVNVTNRSGTFTKGKRLSIGAKRVIQV